MAAFVLAAVLAGCGNKSKKKDDFETREYWCKNEYDNAYLYSVTNNTKENVNVEVLATVYDAGGNITETQTEDISLGKGETGMVKFDFGTSQEEIDSVDYTLSYSEMVGKSAIKNINFEQTVNEDHVTIVADHVTIVATNNGDIPAQEVCAYALFFDKDNNVVDCGVTYLQDMDSEIKPGVSLGGQIYFHTPYDHVEYYYSECSTHDESQQSDINENDFSVKEYRYSYSSKHGSSETYYLVITNNSDKTVSAGVNMIAYDSENKVVGAKNHNYGIELLGPGEEALIQLDFIYIAGIDHVEYTCSYALAPEELESGYKYLECTSNVHDGKVEVTLTNNGSKPIEAAAVNVLFLDENEKLVDYGYIFFDDDDHELKPGAGITNEIERLNTDAEFSKIELIPEGRMYK